MLLEFLQKEVSDFIARPDPTRFGSLALKVFQFQFKNNSPYRNYCVRLGMTPERITSWKEIPAVPAGAFKDFDLTCLEEGRSPQAVFQTSGTSAGSQKRGRHFIPDLSICEQAILPNFAAHLLPDGGRLRMFILAGSPSAWPDSSLAFMLEVVRIAFGGMGSMYYMNEHRRLDIDRLIGDLQFAEGSSEPVILMGITLAFNQLLDEAASRNLRFRLPERSRIMDTGGFKAARIEIPKNELYRRYETLLGIPDDFIVNEYGMTEMTSQFYDHVLISHLKGRHEARFKTIPPWVRTIVLDPETLKELPQGKTGLLKHLDLANTGSVMAILTEDLGYAIEDGFEIVGRIRGSEARGCSLLIEERLADVP